MYLSIYLAGYTHVTKINYLPFDNCSTIDHWNYWVFFDRPAELLKPLYQALPSFNDPVEEVFLEHRLRIGDNAGNQHYHLFPNKAFFA